MTYKNTDNNPWAKYADASRNLELAEKQEALWGEAADVFDKEASDAEEQIAVVEDKIDEQASNMLVFMIAAVVVPVIFHALYTMHVGVVA